MEVIQKTFSICPICSFIDKKEMNWIQAEYVEKNEEVWLISDCQSHGKQETFQCSSAKSFRKILAYNPEIFETPSKFDIEDLDKQIHYEEKKFLNTPLIAELSIFENGDFMSDEEIKKHIQIFQKKMKKDKNFLLKISGNLTKDIKKLNAKIRFILSIFLKNPILVELTFERLAEISMLEDSILLNRRIHPSVKMFVEKENEDSNCKELESLFQTLKDISDLQVVVTLSISRPFPDLSKILELLRKLYGFIRFIIIDVQRTPKQIMTQFKKMEQKFEKTEENNLDPMEVLKLIQTSSNDEILVNDFYPASIGSMLEPFIKLLGMGNFNIRPNPYCGFSTVLCNTESYKSQPITRLIDIPKLYQEMVPIVKSLQNSNSVGWYNSWCMKSAVTKSILDKSLVGDLWSYVVSPQKQETTKETLKNLQLLIIHNYMDVSAVDGVRRTRCSVCKSNNGNIVAECLHCK